MASNAGPIFTVPVTSLALTTGAPVDFWGMTASANAQIELHDVKLAMSSTANGLFPYTMQVIRGSTASSTSATVTPAFRLGYVTPTPPAPVTTVTAPSSGLVSTASATLIYADGSELTDGSLNWRPQEEDRPIINASQRCHIRVTPLVPMSLTGTLTFREIGKTAVS